MITMYNIIHGRCDLNKHGFFTPALTTRTRGHRLKIAKKPATSGIGRQHFTARVVTDWNGLPVPEGVVCAPPSKLNQQLKKTG